MEYNKPIYNAKGTKITKRHFDVSHRCYGCGEMIVKGKDGYELTHRFICVETDRSEYRQSVYLCIRCYGGENE